MSTADSLRVRPIVGADEHVTFLRHSTKGEAKPRMQQVGAQPQSDIQARSALVILVFAFAIDMLRILPWLLIALSNLVFQVFRIRDGPLLLEYVLRRGRSHQLNSFVRSWRSRRQDTNNI